MSSLPALPAVALVTALMCQSAAAQQPSAADVSKGSRSPLTLTGCVDAKRGTGSEILFSEATSGSRYRLTGRNLKKFLGQRVEIVGGSGKGLSIRGGLVPSPNIAAQAGAIDAAQASIARQPGGAATGIGDGNLREFSVSRIRAVDGECR